MHHSTHHWKYNTLPAFFPGWVLVLVVVGDVVDNVVGDDVVDNVVGDDVVGDDVVGDEVYVSDIYRTFIIVKHYNNLIPATVISLTNMTTYNSTT
jgi:hypothetical protein